MELNAKNLSLNELEQAIDASGGLRVSDVADGQALPCSGLQALDVVDSPDLTLLDLRQCPPGLHLLVINCPNLSHVALPRSGSGAVVHLDCGARARRVEFSGLVAAFDACWEGASVALDRAREAAPLDGVVLEDPCGWEDVPRRLTLFDGVEGCVMPAWPRQFPLAGEHSLRHLVVLDGSAMGPEARIENRVAMEAVVIRNAPGLARVSARQPVDRLRLAGVPELASVTASGRILDVFGEAPDGKAARDSDPSLVVHGQWDQARVESLSVAELDARGAGVLSIAALPWLSRLRMDTSCALEIGRGVTRFAGFAKQGRLTAGGLMSCLEQAMAGDAGAIHLIRHWAGPGTNARNRLVVLQKALALAEAGTVSLGQAWRLRCALMADDLGGADLIPEDEAPHAASSVPRNWEDLRVRKVLSGNIWQWHFPDELYRDGWLADVRLFWLCRAEDEAQGVRDRIEEGRLTLRQVAALAECLMQGHAPGAEALFRAAIDKGLAYRARQLEKPGTGIPWSIWLDLHGTDWRFGGERAWSGEADLQLLVTAACRWRDRALADRLVALARRAPGPAQALAIHERLVAHGHVPARRELLKLGNLLERHGHSRRFQQSRTALAMQAAKSDALAPPRETPAAPSTPNSQGACV